MDGFRTAYDDLGDVRLHCVSAGGERAPLIVLLHGFPEFWAGWRDVMQHLAEHFHVVAPDQRGYNLPSKPAGVDAYRARHMVADLGHLADRLSPDRPFVLAGHDWGASVAYAFAMARPERLSHLIVANGVHPKCFQRAIIDDPAQRAASQYINRLRAPEADHRMVEDDFARTRRMLAGFSRTDWLTGDLAAEYRAAWSQPGAMTAMLNWYRASPVVVPPVGETAAAVPILDIDGAALRVAMPHLVIWGEADEALRASCLDGLEDIAPQLTVEKVPDAGHWILHEQPGRVADLILGFSRSA